MIRYDLAIAIYEELTKVPKDVSNCLRFRIIKRRILLHVLVNGVGVDPVHVSLRKHRESDSIGVFSPFLDLGIGAGLLVAELVAWER